MANDLSPVGPKTYGGLKPSCTIGADDFAAHDATKAWEDDGAAETMMVALAPEVRAYGAEQAKQAVLDYTQSAYMDVTVINGEVVALLDVSNNVVPYAVGWKLKDLLQKAVAEAENSADEVTLRAIGGLIEQLQATFRPPAAAAPRIAARPVRSGNLKPPVAGRTGTGNRPATQRPGAAHNARVAATPSRPAS